jgi:hypothetical protein
VSSEKRTPQGGGLSLQTLVVSALAAVAAAVVVPLIWERGTLIATAMTPVVVALVAEGLRKPAGAIGAVAPRVARRPRPGSPERLEGGVRPGSPERLDGGVRPGSPERLDGGVSPDDPYGLRRAHRRPRWQLGLITGLLAFGIGAAAVTASELAIFGGSVSGERGRTTIFGGSERPRQAPRTTPSPSPSGTPVPSPSPTPSPERSPTPVPTATPTPTPTPVPTAAASPSPAPAP